MADVGECSGTKSPSSQIWAKLVPSDSRHSDVEIKSDEIVICSVITSSSSDKHEWCTIKRNSDLCSATLQNKSSRTILADEAVVENGDTVDIKCGSEIIPGPEREGYLTYRFKVMPEPETSQKQLKICIDVDHAKCSICLSVWHDVVTVAPCFHNFCNGCFSEWLRRSQEKCSSVLCPQCRAVVQFAGRNHFLHYIGEDILKADSSLKRSNEEVGTLDSCASIQSNLVIEGGKKLRRKRSYSPVDEGIHSIGLPCPQCGTESGGFRCNHNTVHLQCHACGGMMPSRPPTTTVPQHCFGCDRAFCGAYWHAHRVTGTGSHAICSRETFQTISERTISRIPFWAHEKNRHEQDITEKWIRQMGRTLQDVIAEWITKLNNREIAVVVMVVSLNPTKGHIRRQSHSLHRTRIPLNHAEGITSGTHLCNFFHLMHWQGKIAGMDMHVGRNITTKNMLAKEIMFAVQLGVLLTTK
ncbi:hypothetical protein TIFTF001_001504 [Ficus carica]|uniref:RING-type domain-containing protein n=1 Tax=Ficus carica TaxID=3494 RepID=A0AA87Z982_FICCA|nr:hypothetical protein TIFTF001_001504 [Ficus carica]